MDKKSKEKKVAVNLSDILDRAIAVSTAGKKAMAAEAETLFSDDGPEQVVAILLASVGVFGDCMDAVLNHPSKEARNELARVITDLFNDVLAERLMKLMSVAKGD